jgi:methylenetetrahydrofolate reductase (NADPH)
VGNSSSGCCPNLREVLAKRETTFSFEFFPPRTPAAAQSLLESIAELETLKPTFVSVTYGSGGGTRELTHDVVVQLETKTSLSAVPHLTCIGHNEREIRDILARYAIAGVPAIMALRGDPPRNPPEGFAVDRGEFKFASCLVKFIRKFNDEAKLGQGFLVGVAGYPEGHPSTPNRLKEMDHLKAKVDAGADFIITQMFFDNRDFLDFRERCLLAGIRIPVIAGIMPITSRAGMERMADLAHGVRFPAALLRALSRARTEDAFRRVGVHWAAEQSRDLLDHHVAGIHFYTLNRSSATREVYASLGVGDSAALASG